MCKEVLCRELTVKILTANYVKDVRKYLKTKLYAKVRVGNMSGKTNTDKENETNPQWNTTFKFLIPVNHVHGAYSCLNLEIDVCLDSTIRDDERVGYAKHNIHTLFVDGSDHMKRGLMTFLTLPLAPVGEVAILYFFGEEKSFKKLCLAKKSVNFGTSVAASAAISLTTGLHIPIPIHIFKQAEIVTVAGSSAITGEGIAEFVIECVETLMG